MADKYDHIRDILPALAPGPWEVRSCAPAKPDVPGVFIASDDPNSFQMVTGWMTPGHFPEAEFIAMVRNDIEAILEERDQLLAQRGAAEPTDAEIDRALDARDDHYPTRNGETVDCLCGATAIAPTEYERHRLRAMLDSARRNA